MSRRLRIGLVYESQADIHARHPQVSETNRLYHWRESEEIDAVTQALLALGHEVDVIGSLDALLQRHCAGLAPQLLWNLSVGAQSRNRTALAPAIAEQLRIPYCGADASAKILSLNKDMLKPWLQRLEIATPAWRCYYPATTVTAVPPWHGIVLKPACEGYSLGVTYHDGAIALADYRQAIAQCHADFACPVIAEEYIAGRELTVAVVRAARDDIVGISELSGFEHTDRPRLLDLASKREGAVPRIPLAANGDDPVLKQILSHSRNALTALGRVGYASLDYRIDRSGQANLIDINCDATLHPKRAFAMSLAAAGIDYQGLIAAILQSVESDPDKPIIVNTNTPK